MQFEFQHIFHYLKGKGIDVGCGTNRISHFILSVDQNPDQQFAHADVVHNCKDLDIKKIVEHSGYAYDFSDNSLDFIFSSHCLEDFEDIKTVFLSWWRKIKPGGLMVLLLPDMENGRYPRVGEHGGNPSHRQNVGPKYMLDMLGNSGIKYTVLQCDTLPHDRTCTFDLVVKKQ